MPADEFTVAPDSGANEPVFEWDRANITHISAHDVSCEEAETVISADPMEMGFEKSEDGESRWTFLGETGQGRILQVVITMRGERIRVVTAFEPIRRLKLIYLQAKVGPE